MRLPCRLFSLPCLLLLAATAAAQRDHHSHANPEHVRVRHLDLDLEVLFERRVLKGEAILTVERTSPDTKQPLVLDTRQLRVEKIDASADGRTYADAAFELGKADPVLGQPLTVRLPEQVHSVRIRYTTSPQAAALQWLDREQTATKRHPFLFTQSQAIEARSWIPLQDTPGVRVTYTARVRTPKGLLAVMSARNEPGRAPTGDYRFEMNQPIPPCLIALAVGELEFHKVGPRTGVYGEPGVAARAATEFADMEDMLKAAEGMYGPYRWERYDVLVLPPSFPYGGMENPRLTFASPTVLAGDKSLVSLVAHELAHSWSGNLVSNATWRDFWLNEGFTVYIERRIMEKVYGKARADVEAVLGRRSLERELAGLPRRDQVLHIDLKGRPPIDGLTDVPYEKGALFLRHLEAACGRERFDAFLKGYFDHFAFQSITTRQFADYLERHLLRGDPALAARANVEEWLYGPGIPKGAPAQSADALTRVEGRARAFAAGKARAADLPGRAWTTQEWLHFLQTLPDDLGRERLAELDAAFTLTRSGNSEIVFQWLLLALQRGYEPAYPRLEEFLTSQGRRKFLKPLYEEMVKTPQGKAWALRVYRKARPTYHPLSAETVDAIVGWKEAP
jgi:aminopeptidase N